MNRVAIIGARGRMGALFARRFREIGIIVAEIDRPLTDEKLAAGLDSCDLLLLSVPTSAMAEVAAKAAVHLQPPQIMADLASVKVVPMDAMLKAYSGPVVGTHPLFGPDPGPGETRVAVVQGRDEASARAVAEFMKRIGFDPFLTTADKHDAAVAQIQGLNFVTTLAYLSTLAKQPEIEAFLTPSFKRRLKAAESMITQDAELFTGLFEANPYGQDAVRRFRNFLHVAAGGDVDLLVEHARWWWRPPGAK